MTHLAEPNPVLPPLDAAAEVERIGASMIATLSRTIHRRGVVLGVSGGVDSAVCVSLAARALGAERVFALLMPERDSTEDGTARAIDLCERLGVPYKIEDITDALAAAGAYRHRDDAIRRIFPDYDDGWRQKVVLASDPLGEARISYFDLVVEDPDGNRQRTRMPVDVYRQVIAATNMKQRIRKLTEYYHAERLNFAVLGTPNRLEYELGFFVRGGDGLADLKPIAHLYKSQVYALAAYLEVPEAIRRQPPSTDTYSLEQTQEEFYYSLPWRDMDCILWAEHEGLSAAEAGRPLGLTADQVTKVWRESAGKRRAAARALADAVTVEPIGL
ncbi:MAG: NAD(+) synthase [Rhodospirillaceae bacterium]